MTVFLKIKSIKYIYGMKTICIIAVLSLSFVSCKRCYMCTTQKTKPGKTEVSKFQVCNMTSKRAKEYEKNASFTEKDFSGATVITTTQCIIND